MDKNNPNSIPLAIIGIGCLFPKAKNPVEYWHNIRDGVDAITEVPDSHWNPDDYFNEDKNAPDMTYARRGGFIDPVEFDPLRYGLSPNNIEATDTTQLLGMVVARQALLDAGYSTSNDNTDGRAFDRNRTSVILGVTGTLELVIPLGARLGHPLWRKALEEAGVNDDVAEEVVQRISDAYVPWQENSFPGLLGNVAAGRIANRFDLGGTNCVVDAACASSLSAIHMAALELYSGRADMAITGGFDTFNDIFMYMCFSKTPALSPTGNSRPFDINGDGTILGEGLGAVILKRLDDAKRDNDKIYAVLKGMGSSSDGRGNAIYAPSANGQIRALKNAYVDAGVSPESIELVEAHGTGTRVGDAVETEALSSIYREVKADGTWCALGSVKSMIGHTKAAAGIAGLIKIAMALKHKVLPPTIKIDKPLEILNPGSAPVYVNTQQRPWLAQPGHPRRAAISAFGFGGSNFHCVLEEADSLNTEIDWDGKVLIYALSAKSNKSLVKELNAIDTTQSWDKLRYLAACSTSNFRKSDTHRLVLVISQKTDLKALIHDVCLKLNHKGAAAASWNISSSAFYGTGKTPGKLAMLFPGQGSQYTDMQSQLSCQFPQVQNSITSASRIFDESHPEKRLGDLIYPIPVFTEEDRRKNTERLRQTRYAQPAIGAVSVGMLNLLNFFAVRADMTAGHSFGELTALCAAGVISEDSLIQLAIKRGELMTTGNGSDNGSMLAVSASAAVLHEILEAEQLDLIIANNNAPRQVVLSGATDQIERAIDVLGKRGLGAKKLPVSAAFHSSFVADAEKPFAGFLDSIEFTAPRVPVFSNSTSEPYPDNPDDAKSQLAAQLARPVEFVTEIEYMYEEGARTFVEVGPGTVLTSLVNSILGDKSFTATAMDASRGQKSGQLDLACTLAQIAALGHDADLALWDAGYPTHFEREDADKPAMTVPLTGANYMKPRTERQPQVVNKPTPAQKKSVIDTRLNPVSPATTTPETFVPTVKNQEILQATQQTILSLQKMQQQTADLHRQYLEGQEMAQKAIQNLLDQQIQLQSGKPVLKDVISEIPKPTVPVSTSEKVVSPLKEKTPPHIEDTEDTGSDTDKDSEFESLLLQVVSEKTGYPVNMLSLEMSLDTDLGIDSIKRVEILSALHEKLPGAGSIQPEDLGTFRLLKHIAEFLVANSGTGQKQKVLTESIEKQTNDTGGHQQILYEVISDKTGYPTDMLSAGMNLDTDLGIDSIKRVEILSAFQEKVPGAPAINPDDLASLQTLQQIIDFISSVDVQTVHPKTKHKPEQIDSDTGAIELTGILLEIVADKTGYPLDMLNLNMNLDTDLGIDSIKRVEILSSFQERLPGLPAINPDDLASLQTLQQIVDYMHTSMPIASRSVVTNQDQDGPGLPQPQPDYLNVLLDVVAEKTGYPTDMLNTNMNLDTDLGIDSIKRVEILSSFQAKAPDAPTVNPDELANLQTLQQIIDYMQQGIPVQKGHKDETKSVSQSVARQDLWRGVVTPAEIDTSLQRQTINLKNDGVILVSDDGTGLPDLIRQTLESIGHSSRIVSLTDRYEETVAGLVIVVPDQVNENTVADALELIQHHASDLKSSAPGVQSLLACVSSMGGSFGIEVKDEYSPEAAAIGGIIKTAGKEWPGVICRSIDIDRSGDNSEDLAGCITSELLLTAPVETGIKNGRVFTLELESTPVSSAGKINNNLPGKSETIVISGGARGITAEIATELAREFGTNLLLLGRSPLPDPEPEWLSGLATETEIKKAIIEHSQQSLTPREVEVKTRNILASKEISKNLERIGAQGVKVSYQPVDLRDIKQVRNAVDIARKELGPITGIVHGAGVLADKLIEDKTREQLHEVYTTKVSGLTSLLDATQDDNLKIMVTFSSSTARFGRKGQCDYAAANEVLNKIAQRESNNRKNCRVVSFNWGPWDGGMVTPQLKKIFESEGVGVIPLVSGAKHLVKELKFETAVEVVLLGSEPQQDLISPKVEVAKVFPSQQALHLAFERTVGIRELPVLNSHIMNGKAVLPAALIMEWFAHGALHNNPGLRFLGMDDFRIFKGIILDSGDHTEVKIMAGDLIDDHGRLVVPVELRNGTTLHAAANIILDNSYPESQIPVIDIPDGDYSQGINEIYNNGLLFHGKDLQGIVAINGCTSSAVSCTTKSAPQPSSWMNQPVRNNWLADPLVIDSAFQLMILWSFEQTGSGSLPTRVHGYRQFMPEFPDSEIDINIMIHSQNKHEIRAGIEFIDKGGKLIAQIEEYECVVDSSLNSAFKNNRLVDEPQS